MLCISGSLCASHTMWWYTSPLPFLCFTAFQAALWSCKMCSSPIEKLTMMPHWVLCGGVSSRPVYEVWRNELSLHFIRASSITEHWFPCIHMLDSRGWYNSTVNHTAMCASRWCQHCRSRLLKFPIYDANIMVELIGIPDITPPDSRGALYPMIYMKWYEWGICKDNKITTVLKPFQIQISLQGQSLAEIYWAEVGCQNDLTLPACHYVILAMGSNVSGSRSITIPIVWTGKVAPNIFRLGYNGEERKEGGYPLKQPERQGQNC